MSRSRKAQKVEGTRLEDYCCQVSPDGCVLVIPKDWVTVLSENWKEQSSFTQLPRFGCLASYRLDHYHAHEMVGSWEVHWDYYDPKSHPVKHIFSDAKEMTAPLIMGALFGGLSFLLLRLASNRKEDGVKKFTVYSAALTIGALLSLGYIIWLDIVKPRRKE